LTVVNNLTEVDDCDTAGGGSWAVFNLSGTMGGLQDVDATSEDMTVNIEGTQCYGFDCDKESGGYEYPLPATTDMSKQHLYVWISVPTGLGGLEDLVPAGGGQSGVFLTAKDSSGNRGYWHVAGADTWDGAWKCFVAYLGDAPDTHSGTTPNTAQITDVGFGVDHPNAKSKASCNIFFDRVQYGNDGISVHGGSQGSELDFDHIATQDAASAIGIFREYGGVFFANGPVKVGHDSNDTYFKDTGKTIIFEDAKVSGELYRLEVIEGAGQITEFQLGNLSGTQGIQGVSILAAGGKNWDLLCSGEAVDLFKLYGSTFQNSKWTLLSASGEKAVLSCSWVDQVSGEVYPNGIDFTYNNIINHVKTGMVVDDYTPDTYSYINFIACPYAMEFRVSGEYDLQNVVFTNCNVDIWNNSGGALTINANQSNPTSTSGENITINNTVSHTVTGVAQNSEVTYVSGEGFDATVLHHEETVGAGGETTYQYNYTGDFWVDILIAHLSYEPFQQTVKLGSTNAELPITQVQDRVYSNP
jgi:hypothetical protein